MITLLPLLLLIAVQDILTGIFGAPSIVATIIASKAMGARRAILLSTLAQLIGPLLFGVAVAAAVGKDVVDATGVTTNMLGAALISTVFWMLFAWYARIPCSSTHALIGGLVGGVVAGLGPSAIHSNGLMKMILSLTLTATLGIIGGYVMARLCFMVTRGISPRVNNLFNRGQLVTAVFLGFAVGSNNAQNAMGITTLSLLVVGAITKFEVPHWVIIGSAVCLALGNLIGGTRLIKAMGGDFFQVRPLHGFSAEVSSTLIILGSSVLGGDVSTTHVTSMSIVGAGSAEGLAMVRWSFVQRVLLTWVITIPATAIFAAMFYFIITNLSMLHI